MVEEKFQKVEKLSRIEKQLLSLDYVRDKIPIGLDKKSELLEIFTANKSKIKLAKDNYEKLKAYLAYADLLFKLKENADKFEIDQDVVNRAINRELLNLNKKIINLLLKTIPSSSKLRKMNEDEKKKIAEQLKELNKIGIVNFDFGNSEDWIKIRSNLRKLKKNKRNIFKLKSFNRNSLNEFAKIEKTSKEEKIKKEESLEDKELDELREMYKKIEKIMKEKSGKDYYEITLTANPYKGSGKAWIQRIVDGRREDFVDAWTIDKERYIKKKTYRLKPGIYLVNEAGSKTYDKRYKIRVNPDFTVEYL